jgi:hypothetical protein
VVATLEKLNTAEIGQATGTTVTTTNSAGGGNDAFTTVTIHAGTTLQVTSTAPITGSFSYVAALASTGNTLTAGWQLAAARSDFTFDIAFTIPSAPPAVDGVGVARFYTNYAGTTPAATLLIDTAGKFYVYDTIDGRTSPPTATAPAPGNYIGQLRFTPGQIQFNIYPYGSTTLTTSILMTGLSTFSIRKADVIWLDAVGTPISYVWKLDTIRVGYGGFLPRLDLTPTPPTCTVGPDAYVTVGDAVPMSGTDTAPAGVITGRAWTWDTTPPGVTAPTITGNSTGNAAFTPTTQGYYKARYLVSDSQGSDSAPAYMQTWVAPAAGDPVTVRTDTIGTWTTYGSGASSVARINDTDVSTGVITPGDPTAAAYLTQMNPHGPGVITLTITGNSTGGGITRTIKWYKNDGTTLVDTQTGTAPTSSGDQTFTMSGTGLALIPNRADRAALWVHIESTKI